MEKYFPTDEFDELEHEIFDHLNNGRFKLALTSAKKVYEQRQNDEKACIAFAWALLENGEPNSALEYADLAVQLGGYSTFPRLYRGFILMRLGIYEGAIQDLDYVIDNESEQLSFAYHLKAKCLASIGKYKEAFDCFELAVHYDDGVNKNLSKIRNWYRNAAGVKTTFLTKILAKDKTLIDDAEEAFKIKEYWYSHWVINKILSDGVETEEDPQAKLLQLETMHALFQIKPALQKADAIKKEFANDERFQLIYKKLKESEEKLHKTIEADSKPQEEIEKEAPPVKVQDFKKVINLSKRTDFKRYEKTTVPGLYARTFDLVANYNLPEKTYALQFSEATACYIAVETIIYNPYFNVKDTTLNGFVVWYLNENEVGSNRFEVDVRKEWKNVVFVQSWGTDEPGFWKRGQGRVEIFLNREKICERWFLIGNTDIINFEEFDLAEAEEQIVAQLRPQAEEKLEPKEEGAESLETLLKQLDVLTGLNAVKQAMRDFIDYLEFIKERKKLGLKTQEGISLHSVFLGNPGTGKTTVARMLGKVFKAMGLLPKGHLVEVDRAALVGQYVGETAQKTDKVITDSIGGLLFIDEAYTLVKKGGSGQDFGQEAIDTLLKRMEDKGGEFAVIVAGYPDDMNGFLESNPGMKSRFTHFFNFEDYTPEEMIQIFTQMAHKEDYSIEVNAIDVMKKEFTNLYRKRDKTFGNARLVRNIFTDSKMQLSKRYLKLPEKLRDKKALTTITSADLEATLKETTQKQFKIGIDEENLKSALEKLNGLTGLKSVKKEINELVKLARYYIEQGESIQNRFSDHVVFTGNPGTGKTTIARIFSQIYSALGILPKGHLIEADRQNLVASFVGKTVEKTTELINQSIGGTLFVDEAYTLVKSGDGGGSDFGKEAIDTLLKRMEDDRGKFIVIAAGYTDNMKEFLESNVGLQSRFTKFINFEDYAPDELMVITKASLKQKNLELEKAAEEKLLVHFNEIYRTRDKTFGNARLIRNLVESAIRNQLLRIVEIPKEERTAEITKLIKLDDIAPIIAKKVDKKQIKVEGNKELLEKYLKELNELTGLDSVKKSVDKLLSSLKVAKLREERGLKVLSKNLHAVFLGNPGTGKTTVARLISKIYKEMGLLEKGHLVEVDRSALVAGYQGQTAKKTDGVIEQALGGCLFIDEAYTLSRGGNDFGQEAIDTLLKRMEDFRDSLVVIVAGYTNEMKTFLESNPGLQSRFTNYFLFEDYSPREMLEIASVMANNNGYKLDEGALQLLLEIFNDLYNNRDRNFGNARTVRNILYKGISNQEERILSLLNVNDEDLATVTFDDIQKIDLNNF